MRRLLQGPSGASGASKREEVLFSEEGWARTGTSTGYEYTTDDPAADDEVQRYYTEGVYAEHEGEDERLAYTHYYTAAEGEKEGEEPEEEAEGEGYAVAGEEAEIDEEAYDYTYEAAEGEEAGDETQEYTSAAAYEGQEDENEYEVNLEEAEEGAEGERASDDTTAETTQGGEVTEPSLTPFTLSQIARRVQVRHVEGKGRCLYTRNALVPGEVIFIEKPVLVAVPSINPELWELLTELNNETAFDLPPIWHLAALCSMTQLNEEGYQICMDKWVPDTDREPSEDVLRVCSYLDGDVDPQIYERMLLVWRYNSFGHHTETQGLVLYNRISMMAHSCQATACWHYGADDAFVLRARVSLQRGDEITISYIGDEELFKSTNIRREKVQGWLFLCNCIRCSNPVDIARGFRCPTCGTGSMFFKTDDDVRIYGLGFRV